MSDPLALDRGLDYISAVRYERDVRFVMDPVLMLSDRIAFITPLMGGTES